MVNLDYLYNPDAAKHVFGKNFFVDKKLGFSVIENGTILPYKRTPLGGLIGALGGIVDSSGKYIRRSFVGLFRSDRGYPPPSRINSTPFRNCRLFWISLSCMGALHY